MLHIFLVSMTISTKSNCTSITYYYKRSFRL